MLRPGREAWRGASRSASRVLLGPLVHAGAVLAALVMTGVFTYIAVRGVHFGDVWTALRSSNLVWILPSLAVLALTVWLRALRWRFLFRREARPSSGHALASLLVSYFFNNVLPVRAGEGIRVVDLNRRAGTSISEAAGTVVIERVYDIFSLLLLLLVASPWLPAIGWYHAALLLGVASGLAVIAVTVALAVWDVRSLVLVLKPLAYLPGLHADRVERVAAGLADGFAALRRPGLAAFALAVTLLSWLTMALSWWLVMVAFRLHVSPLAGLLVVIAVGLAMVLPSSPAGVGPFEGAATIALGAYGVSRSAALSYALVLHAVNLIPYVVVGPLLIDVRGRSRGSRRRRAASPIDGVAENF